jgi:tRNA A-37 threonylcarbamoyl transferase component Bud32
MELYTALGEAGPLAEVSDTLGSIYAARGQLENAVSYYAMSIAQKGILGDRGGMAITLGNLGRMHLRAGRFREAEACFRMDLRLCEDLGDTYGRARMLNDIGRARLGSGDLEGALRHFSEGLEVAEQNGYGALRFFAHKDLALVHLALHEGDAPSTDAAFEDALAKAEHHVREAERALGPDPEESLRTVLLAVRGELSLARGVGSGLDLLEDSARAFESLDLPDLEIPTLIALAKALAARGYTRGAERHLDRALSRARRDGYSRYLPVVREALKELELVPSAIEERGRISTGTDAGVETDGYTHLRMLGKGGFGEVYRALDPRTHRVVALKRLRLHDLYDAPERKRLLESLRVELETASRIHHPGIARVFRIGTDSEERPYLVAEFVDGEPLREAMRRGVPDERTVLAFARDAAAALAELHGRGIVHRDLKPENVILRGDTGRPVLIDFGIAYVPSLETACDREFIAGSLRYMAPEQAAGKRVDGRADVYSLGVVLYEWLTGCLPVSAEASSLTEFLRSLLETKHTPIRTLSPALDASLARLVDGMLSKSPQARPDAKGVAELCAALLEGRGAGLPVGPRSDTVTERVPGPTASAGEVLPPESPTSRS